MHHGSGITSRSTVCLFLFFTTDKFILLTCHAFRYRHAGTSGGGNASVDIFDLTTRSKLPHTLRSRMKYVPDFIAALKEAYRRQTVVAL